jgi:hypothetical protein
MPDVSIYVALIAAAAGVSGAAVPNIRDSREAKRVRRERDAAARRQACLDLLRAAGELRTRVANAADYHGDQMGARLAEIRECDAATQLHAMSVALLASGKLTEPTARLASAATRLVTVTARNTDLKAGEMLIKPDFTELDEKITAFRQVVVADAGA